MISVECVTKTDDDHVLIPGFSSILKPTHTVYSHEYLYREVLRLGTRQWAKKPRKLRLKIKVVQKLPPLTSCSLYDCVKSLATFFSFSSHSLSLILSLSLPVINHPNTCHGVICVSVVDSVCVRRRCDVMFVCICVCLVHVCVCKGSK